MSKPSKLKQYEDDKKAAAQSRQNELQTRNFSGAKNFDELNAGLSGEEVSSLYRSNQSFHAATDRLNEDHATIAGFRQLTSEQQAAFFNDSNEATKTLLSEDGYIAEQIQTLAPSLGEVEDERDAQRQFEQDRLSEESRAAETANNKQEILYEGVERLADGRYRLSVDSMSGTSPEIFYGNNQGECWAALRKAKAHATAALRHRARQFQVTKELRELAVDIIPYVPLEQKVTLSAAEIYDLTEQLKDPSTVLEATHRLQLGARTQLDIDRANEVIERGRMQEQESAARRWMEATPAYVPCPENEKAMIDAMNSLGWGVTHGNLQKCFEELLRQEALITEIPEIPEQEFRTGPEPPQPRKVFVPQAAPVAAPKVTPAPAVRPASRKPLNNSSTGGGETSFVRRNTTPAKPIAMTPSEYHSISAVELKTRYHRDEAFKARVDAYWAEGGR
jgi:hypothetical protein